MGVSADPYWVTARAVCTEKQLRVLELRELHGLSLRQISWTCRISVRTVRDQLDAAHLRIQKEIAA
jgi:DNA-directed RNA polymerase specialized sigma24 family protein